MAVLINHFTEFVEKVIGVMRSRGGFGMVLYRENRLFPVAQTLARVVVEIDLGGLGLGGRERCRIDRETVILRGDADLAGGQVLGRVDCRRDDRTSA